MPRVLEKTYEFQFKNKFVEGELLSKTGHVVHYLRFKPNNPKVTIVYFHGNAGALDGWGHMADELTEKLQAEVWMLDYPGFGKSSNNLASSSKQLLTIGEEFFKLAQKESSGAPTVLYGRSLGSGIASFLSSFRGVDGLILETPYYSTTKMAREMFPVVPTFIFQYGLDNSIIKENNLTKILFLHGQKDRVIAYQNSLDLQKENPERVELVTFPEGGHNDLPEREGYWPALSKYMSNL